MHSRVQGDFIGAHVMIITVSPIVLALPPGRNVLADQVITQLLCLSNVCESPHPTIASRIINSDEALPLLNSKWLIVRNLKSSHLALGVEGVKIDVSDDPQGT